MTSEHLSSQWEKEGCFLSLDSHDVHNREKKSIVKKKKSVQLLHVRKATKIKKNSLSKKKKKKCRIGSLKAWCFLTLSNSLSFPTTVTPHPSRFPQEGALGL